MSFLLGILTVLFGFIKIKIKKILVLMCVNLALFLMIFGDDKFYSFVYYIFALGLSQIGIIIYLNFIKIF
ncbi:hypothetical protein F1B92_06610, partial [Campylobacter sp. FMV-PI01]